MFDLQVLAYQSDLTRVITFMVGREFSDGTITGLFALPVDRASIALAKTAVFLGTTSIVATRLTAIKTGSLHVTP